VRWTPPEFGCPPSIHRDAERALILQIGAFVVVGGLPAGDGAEHLSVSVNVSALQFIRTNLVAVVRLALVERGLSPERLHIEITESACLEVPNEILDSFRFARRCVKIALDDFGTGLFALGYLAASR